MSDRDVQALAKTGAVGAPLEGVQRIYELFAARTGEQMLPRGWALAFPDDSAWADRLRDFCPVFRRFHPAFTAEVHAGGADGGLWLRLEGPEGAQPYIESLLQLTSRVEPRWRTTLRWRSRRASAWLRRKPDYLIIGEARCGTTALYRYLSSHPGVRPALHKEIGYFDRQYGRDSSWYRAHFCTVLHRELTGESTPEYLFDPHAPGRVASTLPQVRLIALVRDPVERAYSHYHLQVRNGYETLSFEEAVDCEAERLEGELERIRADPSYFSEPRHRFSYLARGVYADHLSRWLEHFDPEQLLVLSTEAFEHQRSETFRRVLDFLGLRPFEPQDFSKQHLAPRPELDPTLRARLMEYFEPHNQRLAELLGEKFGWGS